MIDVSRKSRTLRTACARARLRMDPGTVERVRAREVAKGDPLEVARVAAIQAAKSTAQALPFCHPIPLEHAEARFTLGRDRITILTTVRAVHKTGVEMEALHAAAVAALTLYDMLKMYDLDMVIEGVRLLEKHGGRSDSRPELDQTPRAGVLVLSDSAFCGNSRDLSGSLLKQRLEAASIPVDALAVVSDDASEMVTTHRQWTDQRGLDLVVTTGGTGLGPRDVTPEAMDRVFDREVHGLADLVRHHGQERTPFAALSRGRAGVRKSTLIVNLPGSPEGAVDALDATLPAMLHALHVIRGGSHPRQDLLREAEP